MYSKYNNIVYSLFIKPTQNSPKPLLFLMFVCTQIEYCSSILIQSLVFYCQTNINVYLLHLCPKYTQLQKNLCLISYLFIFFHFCRIDNNVIYLVFRNLRLTNSWVCNKECLIWFPCLIPLVTRNLNVWIQLTMLEYLLSSPHFSCSCFLYGSYDTADGLDG